MSKTKAFTILEMIITLVVISIVMIMIVSAFTMISTYFSLSQINRELNEECISVRLVMKQDVIEADSIFWDDEVLKIYKENTRVNWYSEKENLTRQEIKENNELEKTFLLRSHFLEAKIRKQKRWVRSVQLHLLKNEKPHRTLTFYKEYPISNYIK